MFFKKNKSKKIVEFLEKFPSNIEIIENDIKKSEAKDMLGDISIVLGTLEQNYSRLVERYKFDEEKIIKILFDAVSYTDAIQDIIQSRENVSKYGYPTQEYADEQRKKDDDLFLKIEEIELRFKNLLGEQYVDFKKLMPKEEYNFEDNED